MALLLLYPAHANAAAAEGAPQIQAVDTQPDPFSFATVTNATPGIGYITEALTVTGITGPAPISVAGGAYKINDGPYLSQAGTVNLNDRVVFLVRSSTRSNKSVSGILTIGGISATFTVVTGDFDTAPDSFPFTPVTDAEQSKTYVSAPATITGITERAAIVVTGGRYRINGGNFTAEEGTVRVGDQVYAEVVASSKASTSTSATVTIGGVASVFKVTTAGTTDTVPNAFSFASVNEAETAATYISAPATISGINAPSPISVSGGRYRINNGNFTGLPGTVGAGDQIYVEVTAANLPGTAATATVTVGGVAGAFTVITAAAIDTVPDRFAFAPVDGAEPGTSYISAPATISGITGPSPISVSGGRYRINDGDFTDITGSVNAGDRVYAEVITADLEGSAATAVVTIGGIAAAFTVTTATTEIDTVPNSFSFEPVTNATRGATYVSAAAVISGINAPVPISVSGGRYRINTGDFTDQNGMVNAGDEIYAEVVAADLDGKATTAIITVGGVAGMFTVTTAAAVDTVPDSFSFTPVDEALFGATYVSAPATITGITGPAPVSVSGGRYRINSGSFTNLAGTIEAGDQIYAEVIAASQASTATTATVTIGGVAGAFTVTTAATAIDTVPDSFSFTPINNAKLSSSYASNTVTITGINSPAPIGVAGGLYRINDQPYTGDPGTVTVNDRVTVGARASTLSGVAVVATLTVGGVASNFVITTTGGSDTVPDRFSFAPVANATPGATYVSAAATITGINAASPISVSGGRYRINAGGFTSAAGTVRSGDQVYAEVVASNLAATAATATVTIGGIAAGFTVTTAADTVPDSFSFAPVTNATRGATYVSAPATVTGISSPSPISVSGGRYRINAGSYTSLAGMVKAGDLIYAEVVASSLAGTTTTATVTIGGVAGTFAVTTTGVGTDTVPDSFSFTPLTNATPGATYVSAPATITGISSPSPISVSGGRYRINAGGYTRLAGTVNAGDLVYAEVVASTQASTTTAAVVTVGGVASAFTVTTVADTVPDSFSFAPVSNATSGQIYVSVPAIITGITGPAPISVAGGLYKINDGPAMAQPGTVNPGDRVSVQVTASSQGNTAVTATATIGGVSASFVVTTGGSSSGPLYPAQVLNFSNWKLTLPVNSNGGATGAAAEIQPAALVGPPGYTSKYMYTDASGAVVFYAPTNGATTTPGQGSDNARSELRELYKLPSGPTEWTNAIGGTLTALCRVDRTPVARKQVIIGQIHGTSSILVLLVYDEALRVVEARYYNSPGGSTSKVQLASNVKIGDLIDYRIQWIGSTLSVTVNGRTDSRQTVSAWNGVKVYFKAGAYSGTGNTGNPAGDASQVAFFNLDVRH